MATLTGDPAAFPASFAGPDDGDFATAASVNVGLGALADRTANLNRRIPNAASISDADYTGPTVGTGWTEAIPLVSITVDSPSILTIDYTLRINTDSTPEIVYSRVRNDAVAEPALPAPDPGELDPGALPHTIGVGTEDHTIHGTAVEYVTAGDYDFSILLHTDAGELNVRAYAVTAIARA